MERFAIHRDLPSTVVRNGECFARCCSPEQAQRVCEALKLMEHLRETDSEVVQRKPDPPYATPEGKGCCATH